MTDRPKQPHRVVGSDGEPTRFKRMTVRECPICNPASEGAKMGVVSDNTGTVILECEHCSYNEFVKPGEL